MNAEMFQRDEGLWRRDGPEEQAPPTQWKRWAAISGAIAALVIGVAGFLIGHAPVGQLQSTNEKNQQQISALHQRVSSLVFQHAKCWTYDGDVQDARRLIRRGEYGAAAALTDLDLSNVNKPACPQTRSGLGGLWYTASIDGLLATPSGSGIDTKPVLKWRGIERRADELQVPPAQRLDAMTVFVLAYDKQLWPLAQASFLTAWRGGMVGASDFRQIDSYYATLRNFGRALVAHGGTTRHQGLRLLVTAQAISDIYRLQRGEAASDLAHLVGRARTPWPRPDNTDPVLVAGRKGE